MIGNLIPGPLVWILLIFGCASLNIPSPEVETSIKPDHSLWEPVLQAHVNEQGWVDYTSLKEQPGALLGYLDHLSGLPPAPDWSRADSLAYYINLYNAATVKLILEHYPVASIQDIPRPWTSKVVRIGKDHVSLGYVEHQVLRNMDEPRIHFAINCASYSCPKLWNKAFTADAIESQLEMVTSEFVNDPSHNELGKTTWELSQIFNWYKGDFGGKDGVRQFIKKYAGISAEEEIPISYRKYDWSLNDAGK